MAGNRVIISIINNATPYSFEMIREHLSSGIWLISPRPVAPSSDGVIAFKARGVNGTATGAVGNVVYSVTGSGVTSVGQMKLKFSVPYTGKNKCSAEVDVADIKVQVDYDKDDFKINANWNISLK